MKITVADSGASLYRDLAEYGYYGIDFSFGYIRDREYLLSDEYSREVMDKYGKAKEAGLKICQTHLTYYGSNVKFSGEEGYRQNEESLLPVVIKEIELASAMECPIAVMHPYFADVREDSRKGNIEFISKILPVLEKNGVTLALENIYGEENGNAYGDAHHSSAEDLLYYTEVIDSPYLGICLDTGHAVIRGQKPVEMALAYGSKLKAVHLHTTIPVTDLHSIPATYSYGDRINWRAMCDTLENIGYGGTFNMEVRTSPKLNDKAKSAFYRFAYAVAEGLLDKTIPLN